MATTITAAQKALLNKAGNSMPELGKGKFAAGGEILLGDLLDAIQLPDIAAASGVTVAVADADAAYGQPEADLINALKVQVNILITLANEIKTKINASND